MEVILYSTNCPKCNVLEKKLSVMNINYEIVTDTESMIKKGFMSAPMLEVDGNIMDFNSAIKWVNSMKETNNA